MDRLFAAILVIAALTAISRNFGDDAPSNASAAIPAGKPHKSRHGNGEVVLARAGNGHFYADADVNGSSIHMLADTGATVIALTADDAERAGISVDNLDFNYTVSTASGQTEAAEVTLDEVRVGSIVRRDVRAVVARDLSTSLLGMSFFGTLSKVAMQSDELVLED